MAKLIEFHVVYDSEHTAVSEFRPVRMLIDADAIESVMENPIEKNSDEWPKGCRVTLTPAVAEFGEGDEIAQGQRMVVVKESCEQIAGVLADERGIIRVPSNLT
ncbi:hypothetical protein [Duganella vulcania]|uniref:Uncharacterized protein n=1 Tax=Duganella vulcania TaxID=2692166 RepID=A0A845GIB4_9BURK|nr:hypothetical protein [Duganella vulcania]MYM92409.1 hypothetical protein [Duganella vulcania]